jgi:hypothetical protein
MSSTAAGLSTTFELGSSAFHRAPSKPWAPPQGITLLDGGFARNKNARAESKPHLEWHPRRLPAGAAQLHAGVSPWDHASPKLRATLSNMSTYDHLERRLKYHRRGRVELSMLRGMLADYYAAWHEEQSLPPSAGFPRGVLHQYYLVSDERQGVRGFLCVVLEPAGKINGGGSVAGRVEHNLAAFYWLDAVEGNEAALREEREKLRRRKAREERLAHEQMAAMQAERAAAAAAAEEAAAEAAAAEKRMRREVMTRRVKAVQRRMLTQIQNRGATTSVSRPFPSWNRSILAEIYLCHACSCQEILRTETARTQVYSLGQTFAAMDQDKSFTLDRQEIAGGMLKQGLELTENEIDLLLNFYDNDGRGQLNYTELVEALKVSRAVAPLSWHTRPRSLARDTLAPLTNPAPLGRPLWTGRVQRAPPRAGATGLCPARPGGQRHGGPGRDRRLL